MKENVLERMERIDARKKMADFQVKMRMPYDFKVKYAAIRAREFVSECEKRELNYHVSVGGLDSITLFLFLKSIHIDAPGISASFLEDRSIQRVHDEPVHKWCWNCGQALSDAYLGRRKTTEEQMEHQSDLMKKAIQRVEDTYGKESGDR